MLICIFSSVSDFLPAGQKLGASFVGRFSFAHMSCYFWLRFLRDITVPILDNPKHEAFARALAEGCSLVDAYERAGYGRNTGNAVRLKANESVGARVAELQREAAKSTAVTVESITRDLEEAMTFARECGAPAALVSAVMGKAKVNGLLIDKTEVSGSLDIAGQLQAARRRARMAKTSANMSTETDGGN